MREAVRGNDRVSPREAENNQSNEAYDEVSGDAIFAL
jgi:hypothetical protein